MIHLRLGETHTVWLTLSEKTALTDPNFLLVATHKTTKDKIRILLLAANDIAPSTSRFNAFTLVTSTYFTDKPVGQYDYTVYEQASDSSTDETAAGDVVEIGLLDLSAATDPVSFNARPTTVSFKVRQQPQ